MSSTVTEVAPAPPSEVEALVATSAGPGSLNAHR